MNKHATIEFRATYQSAPDAAADMVGDLHLQPHPATLSTCSRDLVRPRALYAEADVSLPPFDAVIVNLESLGLD